MRKYIFLYRIADSDDRDCCAYIEREHHLDCIDEVIIHGACYCGRFNKNVKYEEVETFLNKKDFNKIMGKNISPKDYDKIIEKLTSPSGQEFYENIVNDEIEYLKDEYNLDDDDIEEIFNNYSLDYRDRGIVGYVWDDISSFAEEEISECYSIPDFLSNYIDYESLGRQLVEDRGAVILSDDRVVTLNY